MLYLYIVKNQAGEKEIGEMDAENSLEAIKKLKEKKYTILNIEEKKTKIAFQGISFGVSYKDKIIFIKQLSIMVKSGLSLIDALEGLKEQTTNKELIKVIGNLSVDVRSGKGFSVSLKKYSKIFSPVFISVIESGEKSGKLDEVLERLADQMDKEYDLNSKIKNALAYPLLILIALSGVMILAIVYIIPQIKTIFDEMDVKLPLITRILLGISTFILNYWWLFIIIVISMVILFRALIRTAQFRRAWDQIKIRVPIIGPYMQKLYMSRFNRNMATLISAGLPILDALKTNQNILNNVVYQKAIERISIEVEAGIPISVSVKKERVFPPMIAQLVNVGEKTGKLDYVFNTLADFFDREVESTTKNLTTILEPLLTILMGIGVALVVASVIMPIYGLVNAI